AALRLGGHLVGQRGVVGVHEAEAIVDAEGVAREEGGVGVDLLDHALGEGPAGGEGCGADEAAEQTDGDVRVGHQHAGQVDRGGGDESFDVGGGELAGEGENAG